MTNIFYIKMAGSLLVIGGCYGVGFCTAKVYEKRYHQLLMLRQMMLLLREEVRYAHSQLPELFLHVAERVEAPFSLFLIQMSTEMRGMTTQNFSSLWQSHAEESLEKTCLTKDDLKNLIYFGRQIGFLDKQMQLSAMDAYMMQLDAAIDSLYQMMPQKKKLDISLGLVSGFFLAILLA